jgi:hypothetical protein
MMEQLAEGRMERENVAGHTVGVQHESSNNKDHQVGRETYNSYDYESDASDDSKDSHSSDDEEEEEEDMVGYVVL